MFPRDKSHRRGTPTRSTLSTSRRKTMSVTTEKTVRELALENPGATRVFERLGIDYCCGGGQTLAQACQAAHVPINRGAASRAAASQPASANAPARNWQAEPL